MEEGHGLDYRVSIATPPTPRETNNSDESQPPSPSPPPVTAEAIFSRQVTNLMFTLALQNRNVATESESEASTAGTSIINRAFHLSMDRMDLVDEVLAKILEFCTSFLPERVDQSVIVYHEITQFLEGLVCHYTNWSFVLKLKNLRSLLVSLDLRSQRLFALFVVNKDFIAPITKEQTYVLLDLISPLFKSRQGQQIPDEFAEDLKSLHRFIHRLSSKYPSQQLLLLKAALEQLTNIGINYRIAWALQTLVLFAYELAFNCGREAEPADCENLFVFCGDTIDMLIRTGMKQLAVSLLFIGIQTIAKIGYSGGEDTARRLMSKVKTASASDDMSMAVHKMILHTLQLSDFRDNDLLNQCLSATSNPSQNAKYADQVLEGLKKGLRISLQAQTPIDSTAVQVQMHLSLLHHCMYFVEMGSQEITSQLVNHVIGILNLKVVALESGYTSGELKQQLDDALKRINENPGLYQGVSLNRATAD